MRNSTVSTLIVAAMCTAVTPLGLTACAKPTNGTATPVSTVAATGGTTAAA